MDVLPRWLRDPCPPAPFVRSGALAARHRCGAAEPGPPEVLPGLVSVVPLDGPAVTLRARALVAAAAVRGAAVVRLSAAWVWTGEPRLLPREVTVAAPTGRHVHLGRGRLPVRQVRWCDRTAVVRAGGGAGIDVSDPVTTAAECLRLAEPGPAAAAVLALLGRGLLDGTALVEVLREGAGERGRQRALRLLASLPLPRAPGGRGAVSRL